MMNNDIIIICYRRQRQDCLTPSSPIGRRQVSKQSAQTVFCKHEMCNADLSRFQEPSTEPCADASPAEYHDPVKLATMCSDCEYAQYCRKSCGLCQSKYPGKKHKLNDFSSNII
ncbi:uncharacterized protein LOC144625547 [Crassostrea virginica]